MRYPHFIYLFKTVSARIFRTYSLMVRMEPESLTIRRWDLNRCAAVGVG